MPTPFTTLTAGNPFNSVGSGGIIDQLRTGAEQRLRAAFGDAYSVVPMPAVGDAVTSANFWGLYTGPVAHQYAVQQAILGSGAVGQYLDHRGGDPEGANNYAIWTVPTIRAAAGLPVTKFFSFNAAINSAPVEDATKRNTLFLRKRRRRIDATTATHDEMGNPATAGQLAYGTGAAGVNTAYAGNVYRCVASGNWVHDETAGRPNLISNDQDPPNTVCENLAVTTFLGTGWGGLVKGDCMGLWFFDEPVQVMDLMRWTLIPLPSFGGGGLNYLTFINGRDLSIDSTSGSYAGVLAQSAADWAAAAPAALAGDPQWPQTRGGVQTDFTGSSYEVKAYRLEGKWRPFNPVSALAKKWYFYVKALGIPVAGGGGGFDANGDPVVNGTYHNWSNSGGTPDVATQPTSALWPNLGTRPNVPPDPGPNAAAQSGYDGDTDAIILVNKFNVAGGFDRCSVTD